MLYIISKIHFQLMDLVFQVNYFKHLIMYHYKDCYIYIIAIYFEINFIIYKFEIIMVTQQGKKLYMDKISSNI